MTAGAILQKSIGQPPLAVLPLQYAASLALCLVCLPLEPVRVDPSVALVIPLLWLVIAISVLGQLLLYRLIQAGNLVNVTSLFYLVPIVTAVMDRWILGNALSLPNLCGMAAILAGLALVFRGAATRRPSGEMPHSNLAQRSTDPHSLRESLRRRPRRTDRPAA